MRVLLFFFFSFSFSFWFCVLPFSKFPSSCAIHFPVPIYHLPVPTPAMSESTESKYVTLVSSDGFSFVVLREAALVSGTLRGMLSGSKLIDQKLIVESSPVIACVY